MKRVSTHTTPRSLCIVIPIFNEERALPLFLQDLNPVIKELKKKIKVNVIFVNNGSTDESVAVIKSSQLEGSKSAILTLTRNFGYESALIAGLTYSAADCYCLIDADGEDPVNLLPEYLIAIEQGNDVAVGLRKLRIESRQLQSFRRVSYKFLSIISDDPFTIGAGNFSMFKLQVRNAILIENSTYPFLRATVARTGFKTEVFPHNRNPRLDGKSKFSKIGLLKFAIAGFLTTTTWPLRMAAYCLAIMLPVGFLIMLCSLIFPEAIIVALAQNISLFLFLTIQIANIGIISIYVARIYKNSLGRPLFYVDWNQSYATEKFPFEYPNVSSKVAKFNKL